MKKHLPVLQLVQKAKPKLRKSILLNCELDFIKTLIECIYNTLKGNINLSESEKKKLKKYKSILRKILETKGSLAKKRKVISQNGGAFLPSLLAPIVAAGITQFLSQK